MKRTRHIRKFVFLTTALFVSACATTNVGSFYTLEGKTNEGLVVVSLSYDGLIPGELPQWFYRRIGSDEENVFMPGTWVAPFDWDAPPGKLVYTTLPPGRYEFYRCGLTRTTGSAASWHIGSGGVATNNNPSYAGFDSARYPTVQVYAEPFSIPFEIVPGNAAYVGNLHFVWHVTEGKVIVFNRTDRDIPLLLQKLPNLRRNQIRQGL